MGEGYNVDLSCLFIQEIQWAGSSFKIFWLKYLEAIVISVVIIGIAAYMAFRKIKTRAKGKATIASSLFIGLYLFIFLRTHAVISVFPCVYNVPAITAYTYSRIYVPGRHGIRNTALFAPSKKGLTKHIVFIVDETIRGDALTINNEKLSTTPYLKEIAGSYYNYGITSSVANLSVSSNLIMQCGIRLNQIPDTGGCWKTNPNIFQYAKRAGYITSYIDAQNRTDNPQGYMTTFDFRLIDKVILLGGEYPGMKWYEADHKLISDIEKIASSDSSTFTYIDKIGAHNPYEERYPLSAEVFQPAIRGEGVVYADKQTELNTYYNAVRWSVDDFFKELLPRLADKDIVIVYCSDHGESIMEKDTPGFIGHAQDVSPPSVQAAVPILIFPFEKSKEALKGLDSNFVRNKNHASQFQVFPTLLEIMGYGHNDIMKNYGITLFDRIDTVKRRFLSGIIINSQGQHVNDFNFTDTLK